MDDDNGIEERPKFAGAIVIIATLNKGLTVYSLVLAEKKNSGAKTIECSEIAKSELENKFAGRCIRSMAATLVSNGEEERTSLLIALYSSSEGQPLVDQNVDVVRFAIPNNKCSIFQFTPDSSTSNAVPSEKDSVTVQGKYYAFTLMIIAHFVCNIPSTLGLQVSVA